MAKYIIPKKEVVVMVGQSNSGGHNNDAINATITSTNDGSIFYKPSFLLSNDGGWQSPIATGVNNTQSSRTGTYQDIGMEFKLSNLLKAYNGEHHYIIKLTYGGSEITKVAAQLDLNPDSIDEYYKIATKYTFQNAIEQLAGSGKVRIKAITFHQGEAEGANQTWANDYYNSSNPVDYTNPLPYFFQEFKSYNKLLNDTKVLITKVYTNTAGYPYTTIVANKQVDYSNNNSLDLIDMDNVTTFMADNVHWDAPSQEQKGTNVFNTIKDW
tara:strand:- start:224 stop:1030 length:807 start_codon:yes stop_codon:yes gene_type:complete